MFASSLQIHYSNVLLNRFSDIVKELSAYNVHMYRKCQLIVIEVKTYPVMPSTFKELIEMESDDDFDPTETRSPHTRPAPLPAPAQALPHSRRRWRIQRMVGGLAPPASMERTLNISRLGKKTPLFTSLDHFRISRFMFNVRSDGAVQER